MTLDANIVIAYLGGDAKVIAALSYWRENGKILFLPTVAETEILSFSGWTNQERRDTERFLEENFATIAFDRHVARIAASVRRTYKTKFPDAAIAATALFTRTPLITRNQRDFKKIRGLQMLVI